MRKGRKMCSVGPPDVGIAWSTDSLKLKNESYYFYIQETGMPTTSPFFLSWEMGEVTGNFLTYQEVKAYLALAFYFISDKQNMVQNMWLKFLSRITQRPYLATRSSAALLLWNIINNLQQHYNLIDVEEEMWGKWYAHGNNRIQRE